MSNATFYDFHCPLGGKWYVIQRIDDIVFKASTVQPVRKAKSMDMSEYTRESH